MKRLPNWRSRLHAAVGKAIRRPLEWGAYDCGVGLAAACIEAMTGVDAASPFRGRYSNAEEAQAMIQSEGYRNLADLAARHFGFVRVEPAFAQQGDLALIEDEAAGALTWFIGVFVGERVGVMGLDGYGTVDRERATIAFRIA